MAASAVLFAVVSLLWHDSNLWHDLRAIPWPLATVIAWCFTAVQVIGGLGIVIRRTARASAIALAGVYAFFCLASIPDIVQAPRAYASYGSFFEQLAPVCGALAVYASVAVDGASRRLRRAVRLGFAACASSFALAQIAYLNYTASLVPAWIPPNQTFWALVTTLAFALAALALLFDRRARLALRLTSLMLLTFAILVWLPRVVARPARLPNWSELAETLLIADCARVVAES